MHSWFLSLIRSPNWLTRILVLFPVMFAGRAVSHFAVGFFRPIRWSLADIFDLALNSLVFATVFGLLGIGRSSSHPPK
jgi:hypothetical protein